MESEIIDEEFEEYKKNCSNVKTVINWYDLYGGHAIALNKDFQIELFDKAIKKAGNYSGLGRILKVGRKTISNCSKGKIKPKIKILKKIVKYVGYPLRNINNKIIKICSLKPNLPFDLSSEEGAEIIAAFLSDGHNDKSPTANPQYCALEKESHKRLIRLCKRVFGDFKSRTYFDGRSHITKFPAVIGTALEFSGAPRGDQRLSNCYLPKDILLGDNKIMGAYLRRVFDDEGDVCFGSYGKRAVRITRSVDITNLSELKNILPERWIRYKLPKGIKHNLLHGEKLILLKLGIDARLYPEGVYLSKNNRMTAKWRIQIGQQDQLKKFAELIGFNLIEKRKKLNSMLKSYQYRKLPNGEGRKQALEFIKETYNQQGYFKFGDLGKELVKSGRSYDLAGRYLKEFIEKRLIKKVKRGIYVIGG